MRGRLRRRPPRKSAESRRAPPTRSRRVHRNAGPAIEALALAFVPPTADAPAPVHAGSWEHVPAPNKVPAWLAARAEGWQGTIAVARPDAPNEAELVVRAAVPAIVKDRRIGYVIADVPVDAQVLDLLYDRTRVRAGVVRRSGASETASVVDSINRSPDGDSGWSFFSRSVTFFDYNDWNDGSTRRATVAMTFRLGDLYTRLSRAQPMQMGPLTLATPSC